MTAVDIEMARLSGLRFGADGRPANPCLLVDAARINELGRDERARVIALLAGLDQIVIVTSDQRPGSDLAAAADVVFASSPGEVDAVIVADPVSCAGRLIRKIEAAPAASLALVWLLRASESLSVTDALVAESSTYSMLLGGAPFKSWLAARPERRPSDLSPRVRIGRADDVLRVTLSRPARRNAIDAMMRDALLEALFVAVADPAVSVELDADGPSFCAGGDLDEFGQATDLADAHAVRVGASVGRLIASLHDRVTVRIHGACVGAGIELAAFADHLVATPDAWFALPELSMGLIPGAGGTVSLARRIGRRRCAWMALSGEPVDAVTAQSWGLVDALM